MSGSEYVLYKVLANEHRQIDNYVTVQRLLLYMQVRCSKWVSRWEMYLTQTWLLGKHPLRRWHGQVLNCMYRWTVRIDELYIVRKKWSGRVYKRERAGCFWGPTGNIVRLVLQSVESGKEKWKVKMSFWDKTWEIICI